MKVKELIIHLQKSDPEALVVMSCDPEGNKYSPLAVTTDGLLYMEDENDIYDIEEEREYLQDEEVLQNMINEGQIAQVFWPSR